MSTSEPVVSVIVPCFNYGRFLGDCVSSVIRQEGVRVRVLIVDDASTDDTPDVATGLRASDARVEYLRHDRNQGHIATYNDGLDWIAGDFTVLISADDALTPGSFGRAASVMRERPDVGIVYGRALPLSNDLSSARSPTTGSGRFKVDRGLDWIAARCRDGRNPTWSPEVMVRTGLQRAVGGYKPELPRSGDLEMWMRFAASSNVAKILDSDQAYYRLHPHGMHVRSYGLLETLTERKTGFDVFFDEHPGLSQRTTLHRLADRRAARDALWRACMALDNGQIGEGEALELLAFARAAYPDVRALREYKSLRWRLAVSQGTRRAAKPVADALLMRRARAWVRWQRRTRFVV